MPTMALSRSASDPAPGPARNAGHRETLLVLEHNPRRDVVGADFTGAPLATSDVQQNAANIAAITAQPQDVLIYDPPLDTTTTTT
ncbi:hypothetical protein [Bradyrhizobium sp. WSM1743]|uniref:hypothetical protein n=1 Tax=Bradyrhizobium sp. WSM1743 TaxID=318996 RepID=UPI0012EBF515|nr:hypothetical protein [Bradyrhizobium sp. WSM1743]